MAMILPEGQEGSALEHILTIGIPTYNFGQFIGETLDSILRDLPDGVEVLVVDGASTDDTTTVVATFAARTPALRYIRLPQRGGIDADIAKTVNLARGEYVWLCSADDVLAPGAVTRVLTLIEQRPDVLLVAHSNSTFDMRPVTPNHLIVNGPGGRFAITDEASRIAYFVAAATTEALFSFCSGLILRRRTWQSAPVPADFFHGSCWGHAARLLARMYNAGMTIDVETTPLLARRGDNDSFRGGGIVKRFAIAVEGYPTIIAAVFGENGAEMEHTRRILRQEFGLKQFLLAKMDAAPPVDDLARLRHMLDFLQRGSPGGWLRRFIYRAVPRRGLSALAFTVRAFKRWKAQ